MQVFYNFSLLFPRPFLANTCFDVSIHREEALEKAHKAKNRKLKRYALIGLATVGGGALIGES